MQALDGKAAEQLALNYLQERGLSLVCTNFYSRFGEIDLVMRDGECYVFVEVRTRRGGHAAALASIAPAKQHKLVQTARYFMLKLGYEVVCRFDAIAIDGRGQIEWLTNIIQF